MAAFGVVGAIGTHAGDGFVERDLHQHIKQHQCIDHAIANDLYRASFQCLRIDSALVNSPDQLDQALGHAHNLALCQAKQHLDQ